MASATETETETDYVCRKCAEPVAKGVKRCPHCSYKGWSGRGMGTYMLRSYKLLKWMCYVTIIGIPLGLLFRRLERKHERRREEAVSKPVDDTA